MTTQNCSFFGLRAMELLMPSQRNTLAIRRADIRDMKPCFFWANDPVTRQNAFHSNPISWKDHVIWFEEKCNNMHTHMWVMVTSRGLPVGQIRFDLLDDRADIDYSLDPLFRGRGWGSRLLELGISEFRKISMLPLQGRVKPGNIFSRRSFQRLGFREKISGDVVIFSQNP
jgi:UDP-2,4-diacetamido-2,4,6-trideoxy-beta-L-altropyranose hydrolase